MSGFTWILGLAAVAVAAWLVITYNSLVRRRNQVKEAWSDIDVQLKRRYDLVPNLVETVKGYARHEREAFENVTAARSAAMGAQTPAEHAQTENMLTGALKSLFAVAEAYPDLKANTNFLELQRELADTENKIQAARRFYNTNVRDYNTAIESVPTNFVAKGFGFTPQEYFELEDKAAKSVPKVAF